MAGAPEDVGQLVVVTAAARSRRRAPRGSCGGTSRPVDAVLDHLGDPAHVRRDDRARQRHRLEDRQALGLAVRRQHRDVEGGGDGRDVVAAAGEHDVALDPLLAGDVVQGVEPAPLADDQQVRRRAGLAARAATPRAASGGPSPAPAGRRRRRSARSAPCRTRRAACSTAPGGRTARGRRRCRSATAAPPSGPRRRPCGRSSARPRSGGRSTASGGAAPPGPRSERTRDEWTVEITHGRRWPASPSAIAAFVPTISARYMWLWTTSARTSIRCAARMPVAIASSGSSITVTGMPSRSSLRTALPGESETTDTS